MASVFVTRPRQNEQAVTQVIKASTQIKKRTASGELLQKAIKIKIITSKEPHKTANNRADKMEDAEAERQIMEDEAQIEEEDQVGDRPRATAAPSQLTSISGISEQDRV